jgi:hypothetical protein
MENIKTNFFYFKLSKENLSLNFLPESNNYDLKGLRKHHEKDFYFYSLDNNIYFWKRNKNITANLTGNTGEINLKEHFWVFNKIITEEFLKFFRVKPNLYKISYNKGFYTITSFEKDLSDNKFKGLELYRNYELHFLPLTIKDELFLGVTTSISINPKIIWDKKDFENNGVPTEDLAGDEFGKVFTTTNNIWKLTTFFRQSSSYKEETENLNNYADENGIIETFIASNFTNNLNNLDFPDGLEIKEINRFIVSENETLKPIENKILDSPKTYYYRGKTFEKYPIRSRVSFNKPYSYDKFENKNFVISVIYPKNYDGEIRTFLKAIQEEIKSIFHINVQFQLCRTEDDKLESYKAKLPLIKDTNLVIIVVDESHKMLSPNNSPYFFCKAKFLERGISTQEIQIQKIRNFNNKSTLYTDHNFALNIYAKLGGLAWTVLPNEVNDELVIGVGSTTNEKGKPILGISQIFKGNGVYLLGKAIAITNMDDYSGKLMESLLESIELFINLGILDKEKKFRLIFHLFKPSGKKNELAALNKVVSKLSNYSFEYAFVHIGYQHNYRFFNIIDINFVSPNSRGHFIKLNENMGFLCLKENSSSFIKISVDERSNYNNLEDLANQIYQFSELSHRGYNKSSIPITIKYPNLMAELSEKLKKVDGFYLSQIEGRENSLWFL